MRTICIAEDEYYARKALRNNVRAWKRDACVFEAENAQTALRVLASNSCDILMTDIRMPGMDGLALAEKVAEEYPSLYTIIITGYDEFAYAQRALRSGVRDYLLKPVSDDALLETLSKADDALLEEETRRNIMQEGLLRREEMTARQLLGWLDGQEPPPPECAEDGWAVVFSAYAEPPRPEEEARALFARTQAALSVLPGAATGITLPEKAPGQYWGCHLFSPAGDPAAIQRVFPTIMAGAEKGLRCAVSGVLPTAQGPEAYRQAHRASLGRFLSAEPLLTEDTGAPYVSCHDTPEAAALKAHLRQGNPEEAAAIAEKMLKLLATPGKSSVVSLRDGLNWLYVQLNQALSEKLGEASLFSIRLEDMPSLAALREEVGRDVRSVCQADNRARRTDAEEAAEYLRQYVRDHFQENIVLKELATRHLYMNPSYLSRLFKSQTGVSFKRYLTEYRMQWARGMLEESDMSIFRVSQGCGYGDASQFIQHFRKTYGETPSVWRTLRKGPDHTQNNS